MYTPRISFFFLLFLFFVQLSYLSNTQLNGSPEARCRYAALTVLVTTIDAQWEGMGDVGSARYEPALLPPCPTIRVLSYSN